MAKIKGGVKRGLVLRLILWFYQVLFAVTDTSDIVVVANALLAARKWIYLGK